MKLMTPFKYHTHSSSGDTNQWRLACASKEKIEKAQGKIKAYPLLFEQRLPESGTPYLPLVLMDTTRKMEIELSEIVWDVVVLKERRFSTTVSFYEGMTDVYAIKQKKVDKALIDIEDGEFEVYKDPVGIEVTSSAVGFFLVRMRIAGALFRAMESTGEKTTVLTDPIALGRSDALKIFACLEAEVQPFEDKKRDKRYNIERGGCVITEEIMNRAGTASVSSIDAFEQLFGYITTSKYLCSTNKPFYPSMETTRAVMISKDNAKHIFLKMVIKYDSTLELCKFSFLTNVVEYKEMVDYLIERRLLFRKTFIDPHVNKQVEILSNAQSRIGYNALLVTSGEDRSYVSKRSFAETYDQSKLEMAVTNNLGKAAVAWHHDLLYIIKDVCKRRAESVYHGVHDCFNNCRGLDIDAILEDIKAPHDSSVSKKQKIELISKNLQEMYDNTV